LSTRFGFGHGAFCLLPSASVRLRHQPLSDTDSVSADESDRRYFGLSPFRPPWHLVVVPALIWQRSSDQAARQHVAQPEKVGKTNVVEDWKTQTHNDGGQGKMPKNLVEKFLTILLRRKEC